MIQSNNISLNLRLLWVTGLFLIVFPLSANAQHIEGIWLTEKGKSKVEITEQNGVFSGKVIWVKKHTEKEQKNVGTIILKDFIHQNDNTYRGRIFAPHLNTTIKDVITLKSKNEIEVRGYLVFFSDKQIWTRIIKE